MSFWPFWLGGIALAVVPVLHWLLLRRMFAVSGRYSAIVDRLRLGALPETPAMPEADLVEALRAATAEAFGESSVGAPPAPHDAGAGADPGCDAAMPPPPGRAAPRPRLAMHLLFCASVAGGAAVSALLSGGLTWQGQGARFAQIFGDGVGSAAALVGGGLLVGCGTRMSGGCTSGHGLCGVSRVQPGSLLATAAFFGAGIAISLVLGLLAR